MKGLNFELLESRDLMDAKPVLLVIANQDFYYREYNDTRNALLSEDVPVVVAATATTPSTPHPNSGQGSGAGVVLPDIALRDVDADDYSAIVFVGGWGASSYQYAFNGDYAPNQPFNYYTHAPYNGDPNPNDGVVAPQKAIVNDLINEFVEQDKHVGAICHGVTVLAWARVDGASPLQNRFAAVPLVDGTPGMFYDGSFYSPGYARGQYDQALDNGALVYPIPGQYGDPTTATDDVIVDGNIITAQDYEAAYQFGLAIAGAVTEDPVRGFVVNDGAIQRSRVTSLQVELAPAVDVGPLFNPDGIVLRADNGTTVGTGAPGLIINLNDQGGPKYLVITFSDVLVSSYQTGGSLNDGHWRLEIPSLGYVSPEFHRLFGDIDGNGTVDGATDFAAFGRAFGSTLPGSPFDVNGDGTVDGSTDFAAFGANFGRTL